MDDNIRSGRVVVTELVLANPDDTDKQMRISVPAKAEDITSALDCVGADRMFAPWFAGYYEIGDIKIPFDDIAELHSFLDACDQAAQRETAGMEKVFAVLEYERPKTIAEAKHIVDCIEEFIYVDGIKKYDELGRWVVEAAYGWEVVVRTDEYTDFERLGRDYFNSFEFGCGFTSNGYIERTEHFMTLYDQERQELRLE